MLDKVYPGEGCISACVIQFCGSNWGGTSRPAATGRNQHVYATRSIDPRLVCYCRTQGARQTAEKVCAANQFPTSVCGESCSVSIQCLILHRIIMRIGKALALQLCVLQSQLNPILGTLLDLEESPRTKPRTSLSRQVPWLWRTSPSRKSAQVHK